MARTDFQAAWTALAAVIASKTSHGREETLVKMAELAKENEVPEDLLEKAARVAGGVPIYKPEARPALDGDHVSPDRMDEELPGTDDQGGHDGRREESRGRSRDPVEQA